MKLKYLLSVFLVFALLLSCCGCSLFGNNTVTQIAEEVTKKAPEPSLNLAVLKNNSATLGLLELMKNAEENETNYNVSIATSESEIFKLLDENKIDVATLPFVSAVRYHNTGKTPVKMLYSASYMTTKLLSTKNDVQSIHNFAGKPIYTPGNKTLETSSLMYLIFSLQSTYRDRSFMPNFKYANDSDHLIKIATSGKADYCAVSEPAATLIMNQNPDMKVCYDPAEDYKERRASNIVQDCVIVTDKYLREHPEAVETFMTRCKTSIVYSNYNTYSAAELAELYQLVESSDLAMQMIQNSNLIFVDASAAENNNKYIFSNVSNLITEFELYDGYPPESDFYYR